MTARHQYNLIVQQTLFKRKSREQKKLQQGRGGARREQTISQASSLGKMLGLSGGRGPIIEYNATSNETESQDTIDAEVQEKTHEASHSKYIGFRDTGTQLEVKSNGGFGSSMTQGMASAISSSRIPD